MNAAQEFDPCDFDGIDEFDEAVADFLGFDAADEMFDAFDSGEIDPDDVLMQFLGTDDIDEIDAFFEALETGDCDGLSSTSDDTGEIPETTLEIMDVTDSNFRMFDKYINVFGVSVYATSDVSDAKVLHAATVLAEYLDNDEDGTPDNPDVIEALISVDATLVMFGDEGSAAEDQFLDSGMMDTMLGQALYGYETLPPDGFDATLEEVLHLVTMAGYAVAYPDIWGEARTSTIAGVMLEAQSAGTYNPFAFEADMPFPAQVTEYIYWALTSMLDAQSERAEEIEDEWSLYTPELVAEFDPVVFEMLTDPQYAFPQVLPDGHYLGE